MCWWGIYAATLGIRCSLSFLLLSFVATLGQVFFFPLYDLYHDFFWGILLVGSRSI